MKCYEDILDVPAMTEGAPGANIEAKEWVGTARGNIKLDLDRMYGYLSMPAIIFPMTKKEGVLLHELLHLCGIGHARQSILGGRADRCTCNNMIACCFSVYYGGRGSSGGKRGTAFDCIDNWKYYCG